MIWRRTIRNGNISINQIIYLPLRLFSVSLVFMLWDVDIRFRIFVFSLFSIPLTLAIKVWFILSIFLSNSWSDVSVKFCLISISLNFWSKVNCVSENRVFSTFVTFISAIKSCFRAFPSDRTLFTMLFVFWISFSKWTVKLFTFARLWSGTIVFNCFKPSTSIWSWLFLWVTALTSRLRLLCSRRRASYACFIISLLFLSPRNDSCKSALEGVFSRTPTFVFVLATSFAISVILWFNWITYFSRFWRDCVSCRINSIMHCNGCPLWMFPPLEELVWKHQLGKTLPEAQHTEKSEWTLLVPLLTLIYQSSNYI